MMMSLYLPIQSSGGKSDIGFIVYKKISKVKSENLNQ